MKNKRYEFNIHLDEEDRVIIDKLINNNINISRSFKMFIRHYLEKIEPLNNSMKQEKYD